MFCGKKPCHIAISEHTPLYSKMMIGYIPSYYKCVNIILFLIKPASLPLLYWFYSTKRNAISKSDDYHNYYFHSRRLPYILAVTVYIYRIFSLFIYKRARNTFLVLRTSRYSFNNGREAYALNQGG